MKRRFVPARRRVAAAIRMCVIGTFALSLLVKTTVAQEPSGTAAAGRLQQEEPNKARGGKLVPNRDAVIKVRVERRMEKLTSGTALTFEIS